MTHLTAETTHRAIANRVQATPDEISQAVVVGWTQGVQHAMWDGMLNAN